ncbi:hypothetical protein [Sphingomonas yabuuchiae]|uniref:Uncharacterized protein n=1 Tax=Sphingomonas yabuuchiae TaxID=172044 RepID=A0AA41DG84_9SPHN|nr:hypothetical protein [Sphingomonas yabuuchiae]MBB4608292.1 hypothetical protein [Sphingomonas yabuuchiae]MBN3559960.1 hypothetical protein [Sphingomonas yabuuchiae]
MTVKRAFGNVFIALCIVVLVGGVVGFAYVGLRQDRRLALCLQEIDKQRDARSEQRQTADAPAASATNQQQQPTQAHQQESRASESGPGSTTSCRQFGNDAGIALSRASFDLSLLGYLATLLFGTLGVLGIFLSYTTSRDARDDARRQAAAPGGAAPGAGPGAAPLGS